MNFEFEIPRSNAELLEDANCSNYFVKQIYDAREIPTQLRGALQALKEKDAFYIFNHFDAFFSVTENAKQLDIKTLLRAIDILYRSTDNFGTKLDAYLKQENLDKQNDYLNLIKMLMYLLVSTVRVVDAFEKQHVVKSAGRKNKKKSDEFSTEFTAYATKRYDILIQTCNILRLPIEKLWANSIVEETFVNLVCDLAYRSLVHESAKEKRVNDAIFQILGLAIKRYSHGIAFPVQIVKIMESEELAVASIARGVIYLNEEFGIISVLGNLLNEFIEKVNINPASAAISKHLSLFIAEIGETSADLSLQCLELAQDILNLESYVVRNSLFGLIWNTLVNKLNGEDLNDDQKMVRDECLEDLFNHINDVSSYVRSKVLQVWNDLKNRNAVPLDWMYRVLTRAIERLEDKTATVRKNAITLLKSFLESNPFSPKLQVDVIKEKLRIETENMQAIRDESRHQYQTKNDVYADFENRCVPNLEPIFTEILSDAKRTESLIVNCKDDKIDAEERIQNVRDMLKEGHFAEVAEYIIRLDALVGHSDEWKSLEIKAQVLYFVMLLKTYLLDHLENKLEKQAVTIAFLEDALAFSEAMSHAVPKLEELLMSTTVTDALEAIDFFKTGYLFGIKGTENGMRLMLRLLYVHTGQDKNEKGNAVMKSYHQILFATDATGRAHHCKVVENMCKFLQNISTGEYAAFELMIEHWVRSNDIDANVITVLFERFTFKLPETTQSVARCCMELLIIVSKSKPIVAQSNMKLILDIVNSHRILDDPRIFAGCLKLLMNTVPLACDKNDKGKIHAYYKRFDDKDAIDGIISTFENFFFFPNLPDFELIASRTINFLYTLCPAPDMLSEGIVHMLCKRLNEMSNKRRDRLMQIDENDNEPSQSNIGLYIPKYLLPRIIYIFGYIATKEMTYLHDDVSQNMKYREELSQEHSSQKYKIAMDKTLTPSRSLHRLESLNQIELDEPDTTYMGATAEDHIGDMINSICEHELIGSTDGLLYHLLPVLIHILREPGKYTDNYLQRAAVLALMRFMAVSGKLCADKIAFLMNILKRTKSASIKCNIIVGLADLTGRFANTIEPWIPNFYTLLLETDTTVRLTTMKMLSFVILQAVIRVTGQISDIAACLADKNPDIRSAAMEFFRQLIASKEQEYCKIMPDVVSRLSSNESPMLEDKFRLVMRFLFELIHKDRQTESLVEKLCSRFRNTNTERQWRDIAFCLSLISPTEKTMKKLIDHLPNYKDKVHCDDIYDFFKTIIANANKQVVRPVLKELTKEFDAKLQKCFEAGNVSVDVSMIEVGKTPSPKKKHDKKKAARAKKKNQLSSDEDDDDFMDTASPPRRRGLKRRS